MNNKSRTLYFVFGLAFLLAIVQIDHILLIQSATLGANIDAALGVTTGHPHWRVDQNRVLGPYLLKGLAGLFPGDKGYVAPYLIILAASLVLAGYQAWRIGNKIGGAQTGWFALILLHLFFAFFLSKIWLYIWDFIGLNVYFAFVEFVICEVPWYWFTALFAIGILNRESGQFISLWLVLQPICCWLVRKSLPWRTAGTMLAAGLLCLISGALLVDYLRTSLLIEEVGFRISGGMAKGYGPNFHWKLPYNILKLEHVWGSDIFSILSISLPLTIYLIVITFAVVLVRMNSKRYLALAMTSMVSGISILLFGTITETRVFIEMIPFLILGSCLLFQSRKTSPLASAPKVV
jgi:hypothetical protein